MSSWNFVLSWVKHEKSFVTSRPVSFISIINGNFSMLSLNETAGPSKLGGARHVKFLKKNAGQRAENPWFFLKIRFPMSTDVVNPAVRDAEMLPANLAVRLLLVPIAGHNPVKRSRIFCIKIWYASISYSLFCWANSWRWFAFRHLCWVYQVIQPLGLFVPVLFALHSSP